MVENTTKKPVKKKPYDLIFTLFDHSLKKLVNGKFYNMKHRQVTYNYIKDKNGARRVKIYIKNTKTKEVLLLEPPKGDLIYMCKAIKKDHKINNLRIETGRHRSTKVRKNYINPNYEHLFRINKPNN